jgi:hypothetical protein
MDESVLSFTKVVNRYVHRSGYTPGQLARFSGVPQMTIVNWRQGRVKKPRAWQDVVRLAQALRLRRDEANELLRAAGYPPISRLQEQTENEAESALFSFWAVESVTAAERPPFQAVRHPATFVGRGDLLPAIEKLLLAGHHETVTILEGMAGVGKTALAAYLAYRLRPHLPDGVLWARLDTSNAASILHLWAAAYGRDVTVYDDLESRSTAVRDLLAAKRALLVLDNVTSSQEIRPLLPPAGPCAVLITTRRRNLTVAPGAHRFHLEPFDAAKGEALRLFTRVLGAELVARERAALVQIADLLGHLPLAIDVVAWRLAHEPHWTAADFLARLQQEENRLKLLESDLASVQLALEASYALLSPVQQSFFAALGAFGGEDFSPEAAAAVAGVTYAAAEAHLRTLFCLSLVRRGRAGRYRLVPLLRNFAREKITTDAVWQRLVRYYAGYTTRHKGRVPPLDPERNNVIAAFEEARARGIAERARYRHHS